MVEGGAKRAENARPTSRKLQFQLLELNSSRWRQYKPGLGLGEAASGSFTTLHVWQLWIKKPLIWMWFPHSNVGMQRVWQWCFLIFVMTSFALLAAGVWFGATTTDVMLCGSQRWRWAGEGHEWPTLQPSPTAGQGGCSQARAVSSEKIFLGRSWL